MLYACRCHLYRTSEIGKCGEREADGWSPGTGEKGKWGQVCYRCGSSSGDGEGVLEVGEVLVE